MTHLTHISDKIINYSLELERELIIIIIILSINLLFFTYCPEIANGQDNDNQVVPLFENNSSQAVPWIGADVLDVKEGIANVLGVKERIGVSGVLVIDVIPGSPAEEARLQEGNESVLIHGEEIKLGGDIIIKVDNKTITSTIDYNELLRQKRDGDILDLTVLRGGQPIDIPVVVGSRPGFDYESSSRYNDARNISFEPYESFDLEFQINYPSQWEIAEKEGRNSILFESNPENSTDRLQEFVEVSFEPLIGNGTLQERNSREEAIVRMENLFQNMRSGAVEISSNSSNTILAGNPARIVEYHFILQPVGQINAKEIISIIEDEVYCIRYFAEESKFDDYLPTIESMIDSFNISPVEQYENFHLGVRMNYSDSAWDFLEESQSHVRFISPVENNSRAHDARLRIFALGPFDRSTLEEHFNDTIQYWKSEFDDTKSPNFTLINSTSSHLENMNQIHNVTYSYGDPDRGINIRTHIITIKNDKVYTISYSFGQENQSNHAPVINKMIKSIEFFNPALHADTNLGLLLQYPSDVSIVDQEDNGSIIFSFGPNIDSDRPFVEPQFAINVYTKENSTHNETDHDIVENNKNKRYELNTTSHQPVDDLFFTYQGTDNNNTLQVNAIFKNKKYNFRYSAEPDEYRQFISTVEAIINSTRIIDSNLDETNKSEFARYDSSHGFTMEYPLEWHPIESGDGSVEFKQNKSDEKTTLSFRIYVVAAEDWKIYDFVDDDLEYITENYKDLKIIRSKSTNHTQSDAVYDAYDLEYTIGGDLMWMDRYVLNDNNKRLYHLQYGGELNEFYTSLPIIQQMISSLVLNETSEPRTYTGFKVSDDPRGIAVNPRTNTIYVAHMAANTVSAINGSNNEIITDIAVSSSPIVLAVNPIKNTIYVTHQSLHNGSISLIDGKSNTLIANIPLVMKSPISLAVNPSTERVYVADGVSKNVSVIDTSTNKVVDSIATGRSRSIFEGEHEGIGIAVDSLRNRIYVANPSTGNVTVIDGLDNSILSNISTSFRQDNTSDFISPFDIAVMRPFDIAVNQYTNIGYIVGNVEYQVEDGGNSEYFFDQRLAAIDFSANNRITPYNVNGSDFVSFNVVAINPLVDIIYLNDVARDIFYGINAKEPDRLPVANITLDDIPYILSVNPDANIIYVTNLHSDTVSRINGNTNNVTYGVRFDINDGAIDLPIFFGSISVNPSKSINIRCNEASISDNDYVHYDNGTQLECSANSKHAFSPLITSSWTGFDSNQSNTFTITRYGTITASVIDLESLLQTIGPYISLTVLAGVVLAASIPSFSPKIRKVFSARKVQTTAATEKKEPPIIEKPDIITADATVIIGVLIFIGFSEGFELAEQTQITIITVNIVFPFAISAVLAVRNYDKFAIRLMIAGFINLMISVILIAIMRL